MNNNNLEKVFENKDFGKVRIVIVNNEPYFVGSDVAKALDYDQPYKAVKRHCRYGTKHTIPHPQSPIKKMEVIVIPESDLYRLITHSKLPTAENFELWVYEEVLPSIRKTGKYDVADDYTDEEKIAMQFVEVSKNYLKVVKEKKQLEKENAMKQKQIEHQKPKVDFYEKVASSTSLFSMEEVAKTLNHRINKNKSMGIRQLYAFLRDNKILMKKNDYHYPYQKYVDAGYFKLVEGTYECDSVSNQRKETRVYTKVMVFQKGINFIRQLLANNDNDLFD